MISAARKSASAFAPASVANVAVGFDLLGFAVDIAGDTAHVEVTEDGSISVGTVSGLMTALPMDPEKNTATAGLVQLKKNLGLEFGFRVSVKKGIPLGSGLGGSAASSVAALVAANSLLSQPLDHSELIQYALIGEYAASGSYHADNVAPSMYGGMTMATLSYGGHVASRGPSAHVAPRVTVSQLPVPKNLWCVLLHPQIEIETKMARGILKKEIHFSDHLQQSTHLASFLIGLFTENYSLLRANTRDLIVEPQRRHLIPSFDKIQTAALSNDAICCTISGAGPTVFAWAESESDAKQIESAMMHVAQATNLTARSWYLKVPCAGARVC
ncbi:MAG: homoserine kinase [Deltaproteobacteria bacterium]|jgi:homoserine kinase|nr:homoserine kinase [Deltaproteobacteria bacterium]